MKKILVVVDMQNDFITGPLGNDECRAVVPKVVDLIKNGRYDRIIYTQDTHDDDYLETNEGKHLPVKHCIVGTEGWELAKDIENAIDNTDERITMGLTKKTFGSLFLPESLKRRNEITKNTQIDFCGVCTGICVISNVMLTKAAAPEANIRVIADACACVTPESHERALAAMEMCHIEIVR